MPNPLVVIDTSTLIAASIIHVTKSGQTIRHIHHNRTISLLCMLEKGRFKGTGCITDKVKSEIDGAFDAAVKSVWANFPPQNRMPQEEKRFRSACRLRKHNLLRFLPVMELDENRVKKNLADVEKMSVCLREKWNVKYGKNGWRRRDVTASVRNRMGTGGGKGGNEDAVCREVKQQIEEESGQLGKFYRGHPHTGDKTILSGAIALKTAPRGNETRRDVMIASCDTGFFSPRHMRSGIPDTVTREIFERFGILCDWPDKIACRLKGVPP